MKQTQGQWLAALVLSSLLLSLPALAQEDSSSASPAAETVTSGPSSNQSQTRQLGAAQPLSAALDSLFRLGPIYVQSVQLIQVEDTFHSSDPTSASSSNASISIMQATAVYNHAFRKGGDIALQYQPEVIFVNGRSQSSLSNNVEQFNFNRQLTPRWTFGISDSASYSRDQTFLGNLSLSADFETGNVVQQNFLRGPGRYLTNAAGVSLVYLTSPRSQISISLGYDIVKAMAIIQPVAQNTYNGQVSYSYELSRSSTLGFYYSFQESRFSQSIPLTLYHGTGITYELLITPTWRFSTSLGASAALNLTSHPVTETGRVDLIKSFRRSSLAFTYYRGQYGQSVSQHVTNSYTERFDLSYSKSLTQRIQAGLGAGRYREFYGTTDTKANYAQSQLSIQMLRNLSLAGTYGYLSQLRGGNQLFSGSRREASVALVWQPQTTR